MKTLVLALLLAASDALACGVAACLTRTPESKLDPPHCADFDLSQMLIATLEQGDRSVIPLLARRFDDANTFSERRAIAVALLGVAPDDSRYFGELARHAEIAVRFPNIDDQLSPEFLEWCEQHAPGEDPESYRGMTLIALTLAGEDQRGRPLLMRALETNDAQLIATAINVLTSRNDAAALPAIEKALKRVPAISGDHEWVIEEVNRLKELRP